MQKEEKSHLKCIIKLDLLQNVVLAFEQLAINVL